MTFIISIGIALFFNALTGLILYAIATTLIPEKQKEKFYEIVPLYPKPKYSVILYSIAAILYTLACLETSEWHILISILSVIFASQITRGIAKIRNEDLEESYEEEMERKRNTLS
jgi:hypothetical protein